MFEHLTESHSSTWIVIQHVTNNVEELQVFGSVVNHVAVKWFRVISNVATSGRLFIPVQLSVIKVFCFRFPVAKKIHVSGSRFAS